MSIHEIQPQFTQGGGPSPKYRVDSGILERGLRLLLNDILLGRNIVVDVCIRDTVSSRNEWRICIPPKEYDLYRAISNIVSFKDAVYSDHVKRGNMRPREFVVNVWCRAKDEKAILGSTD